MENPTKIAAKPNLLKNSLNAVHKAYPINAEPPQDYSNSTFGVPDAPGTTNTPGDWAVTDDSWLVKKQHWTDTPIGKTAIEFVSRITLGGLFFSLMENSDAMRRLGGYEKHNFSEERKAGIKNQGFLEKIAYGVDKTIGEGLYTILDNTVFKNKYATKPDGSTLFNKEGKEITRAREYLRFRENRITHDAQDVSGRSLGAEMTVVTASFAAMSAGSAIMRNTLAGIFNPKERASWAKNGEFDAMHIVKKLAGKVWKIGTYNAGEDMAVALPYVFFMRGQRNLLDKVFKGFKYSSDGVDNGSGILLNDDGKVSGHTLIPGALDLQGRFTVYNVFTQLYRDIYDNVGDSVSQWWKGSKQISAPTWMKNPTEIPGALLNGTRNIVKYTTISTIRSIIQMTPSVPFFSIFRIPGSKVNGMAVHAEDGPLHFVVKDDNTGELKLGAHVRVNSKGVYYGSEFKNDTVLNGSEAPPMAYSDNKGGFKWFNNDKLIASGDVPANKRVSHAAPFQNHIDGATFDPHGFSKENRALSNSIAMQITDSIGRNMHSFAESDVFSKAFNPLLKVADKLGYKSNQGAGENADFVRKRLAKDSIMAGIPYASYFAAKVMTRESYVNEQMNLSVERLVDGILSFNRKEVAAGLSEISQTVFRQPFQTPKRQAALIENHLENPSDQSPRPIDWTPQMHSETLMKRANGTPVDRQDLMDKMNKGRLEYYSNSARKPIASNKDTHQTLAEKWARKPTEAENAEVSPSIL